MYVKRAQLLAEREYRGKIDKEKGIANAEVIEIFSYFCSASSKC